LLIQFVHTLTRISHQTLWTSSEAEPASESAAPAEKKEEAPAAEAEKPAAE
jgi:14-3-3 protein epsilon